MPVPPHANRVEPPAAGSREPPEPIVRDNFSNQALVADITYIPIGERLLYLAAYRPFLPPGGRLGDAGLHRPAGGARCSRNDDRL